LSRFVLDASVALSWCFQDEASAYADQILHMFAEGAEAHVPAIWPFEVCNALVIAERRNRIGVAGSTYWLNRIAGLQIVTSPLSHLRETAEPFSIAREYGLTIYDAAYLELAHRSDLPLATIDRKLQAAARRAGIPTDVSSR
jgi:predicted nucleic acid-binding protein